MKNRLFCTYTMLMIMSITFIPSKNNCAFAQVKSNLEILNSFADSAFSQIMPAMHSIHANPSLQLVSPTHAQILEPRIREDFKFLFMARSLFDDTTSKSKIIYNLEKVELNYPELYRDGFLGNYYFTRSIVFSGSLSYVYRSQIIKKDFSFVHLDTLKLEQKDQIENSGFQITQKQLPSEPFFVSLTEPLIVTATLVISVYLLFTTRGSN
ncbi:MAG: hypothetical protein LWX56_11415 [Ignavibacteria bacterium]|nr:hypothetical protein [Ignavibacteria bacterium]